MYDDSLWPRISIVTPSYNQGQFIEDTIQSILIQEYPDLEFIIIDGGSTDNSVEIIKKYENNLTFWVSESDGGQYDAINRGFSKTTGEIMAWLNSDDKYTPWTFSVVGDIFRTHPEVEWVTTLYPLSWDEKGRAVACSYIGGFNHQSFLRGVIYLEEDGMLGLGFNKNRLFGDGLSGNVLEVILIQILNLQVILNYGHAFFKMLNSMQ